METEPPDILMRAWTSLRNWSFKLSLCVKYDLSWENVGMGPTLRCYLTCRICVKV